MNRLLTGLLVLLLTLPVTGCDLIGDIIEFTFWTILILVGIIVLLVWGLIRLLRGRGGGTRRPPPTA